MSDERFSNDKILGSWLKELAGMEVFSAQLELENRILSSSRSKLESLSLTAQDLGMEYTRVRSTIDAIKGLQAARSNLIDDINRNPALQEKKKNNV